MAVGVNAAVAPEATSRVPGLKVTTGAVISLVMEIVSVPVPSLLAASEAVAVHVAMVSALTTGAV